MRVTARMSSRLRCCGAVRSVHGVRVPRPRRPAPKASRPLALPPADRVQRGLRQNGRGSGAVDGFRHRGQSAAVGGTRWTDHRPAVPDQGKPPASDAGRACVMNGIDAGVLGPMAVLRLIRSSAAFGAVATAVSGHGSGGQSSPGELPDRGAIQQAGPNVSPARVRVRSEPEPVHWTGPLSLDRVALPTSGHSRRDQRCGHPQGKGIDGEAGTRTRRVRCGQERDTGTLTCDFPPVATDPVPHVTSRNVGRGDRGVAYALRWRVQLVRPVRQAGAS